MYVKQLSVFIENREGRLFDVLETLKEGNINIVSLALADTSDYGLLRLIVSDSAKAKQVLRDKGFSAMLTEVLAVKLPHNVGELQILLKELNNAGINIEYMYALATSSDDASIVIKTTDLEKAAKVLKDKGVKLIESEEVEG
jgi:hypothetical protein